MKIKVTLTVINTFDLEEGQTFEESKNDWEESVYDDPMAFVDSDDAVLGVVCEEVTDE